MIKTQAENLIREANIEFPKDAGHVLRWVWSVYDPSLKLKVLLIPSISIRATWPAIDIFQKYLPYVST